MQRCLVSLLMSNRELVYHDSIKMQSNQKIMLSEQQMKI